MTQLVASLLATSVANGLDLARRAQRAGADLVELRLDHFDDPDQVRALVRAAPAPVLAACRVREDGGAFSGGTDLRRRLLLAAAEAGAAWLDLEHWEGLCLPAELRTRVLRSYHRLQSAPRDLPAIVARMARSGADALKVTIMGYDAADLAIVHELYQRRFEQPLVAFLAGQAGRASRFLAVLQGAPFLYCALGPGQETAGGQPELFEARELYRAAELGLDSRFWGLLGSPVDHSLGYRLHNGLHRFLRDVPVYLPFDSKHPERMLRTLRDYGPRFLGLSVTAPHKQKVVSLMDELGAEAEACGAVNTIVHRDHRLRGENSDVAGVQQALAGHAGRLGGTLRDRRALVIGGGGSARAACLALIRAGARTCLAVRSRQRIREFAARFEIPLFAIDEKTFRLLQPEILVHATPIGQERSDRPDAAADCLIPQAWISQGSLVLDLVYRPAVTTLLRRAEAAGAHPISGLAMFLHQAIAQIRWVLGDPDGLPAADALALLLGPEGRAYRAPPCGNS